MSNTIYDEKVITSEAAEIVKRSNEHGSFMSEKMARQLTYCFRSGRLEILSSIWSQMTNGADKAWFSNLLTRLNRTMFTALKPHLDPDDVRDIIATGNVNDKGWLPLFDGKDAQKIVWIKPDVEQGAKSGQQIFRRALREKFSDDISLSETFAPFFEEENDAGVKRASEAFDTIRYLKRVVTTLETKVPNDDQAGSLARAVNKVIADHFTKQKAFSNSEIAKALKARNEKEQTELDKALELAKAKGYVFEAPKPTVIIDNDANPEAKPGDNAKDITPPKVLENKSNDPRKAKSA